MDPYYYDLQEYSERKKREIARSMGQVRDEHAPILSGVGCLIRGLGKQLATWAQALEDGHSPSRMQQTRNTGSS